MGRRKFNPRRSLVPVEVISNKSFIDTVCLILPERMPKASFQELRRSLCLEQRSRRRRYVLKKVPTANGYWIYKMFIHQPTENVIKLLESAEKGIRARVLEVHIALDLATKSFNDATLLQDFIEERLIIGSWVRKPIERVFRTAYFNADTRAGSEVVLYSDRKSKLELDDVVPCLHIEWRVIGKRTLEKFGFDDCLNLLTLDHQKFWQKQLALWVPPSVTKLARARNKAAGSRRKSSVGNEINYKTACNVLRGAMSPYGVAAANDILVLLRKAKSQYNQRPARLFVKEPTRWMLPERANAMWDEYGENCQFISSSG